MLDLLEEIEVVCWVLRHCPNVALPDGDPPLSVLLDECAVLLTNSAVGHEQSSRLRADVEIVFAEMKETHLLVDFLIHNLFEWALDRYLDGKTGGVEELLNWLWQLENRFPWIIEDVYIEKESLLAAHRRIFSENKEDSGIDFCLSAPLKSTSDQDSMECSAFFAQVLKRRRYF